MLCDRILGIVDGDDVQGLPSIFHAVGADLGQTKFRHILPLVYVYIVSIELLCFFRFFLPVPILLAASSISSDTRGSRDRERSPRKRIVLLNPV